MPIISVKNLSVKFNKNYALKNISFEVEEGEYIGIIGPNGAGKSTLLKSIIGIQKTNSGTIKIEKNKKIAYIAQYFLLNEQFSISVEEILQMNLKRKHFFKNKSEKTLFIEKLKLTGLDKSFLNKNFNKLSGGQKQRVLIARSLIRKPDILLFDEALSGVDLKTKIQIHKVLAKLNKEENITIIFVSHEIESIIANCHKILCIDKEIHKGCHTMDFTNKTQVEKICTENKEKREIVPIHHHHK